jgi:pimeloyl-ACP methyl ester carboxylesterase
MAGFVLIHGSWHGGWCFDLVADILRARGHTVVAPTLPGMGGTAEEMAAVTLASWGEFAAQHCRDLKAQGVGPVVLAGHSRGGLVVSTAAERDTQAMDALVYICAMMLPSGMTCRLKHHPPLLLPMCSGSNARPQHSQSGFWCR